MAMKYAHALVAGDTIDPTGEGVFSEITDFRPRSLEWPITVAVKVDGVWQVLAGEAAYPCDG